MQHKRFFIMLLTLVIFIFSSVPSMAISIKDIYNTEDLLQVSNVTAEELDDALYYNLKGLGYKYVEMEKETGVNAIFIAAISALESGWGTSKMAKEKNNLFGYGKGSFETKEDSIETVAKALKNNYLSKDGPYFKGYSPKDVSYYYCPNSDWGDKVSNLMYEISNRVLEYKKAHPVSEKKTKKIEKVEEIVSAEEKVITNYKNGGIIKEVNLILKPSETKNDFINKTSVNDYANLELYGKCNNVKVKIVKFNENKK